MTKAQIRRIVRRALRGSYVHQIGSSADEEITFPCLETFIDNVVNRINEALDGP